METNSNRFKAFSILALLGVSLLAGCGKDNPPQPLPITPATPPVAAPQQPQYNPNPGYPNGYNGNGQVNWNNGYSGNGGYVNWGSGGGNVNWGGPYGGGNVNWGSRW